MGQCGEGCTSGEHGHGEKRKRGEGEDEQEDTNAATHKKPNEPKIRVSATRHDSKVRAFTNLFELFRGVVDRVYTFSRENTPSTIYCTRDGTRRGLVGLVAAFTTMLFVGQTTIRVRVREGMPLLDGRVAIGSDQRLIRTHDC